MRFLSIFFLLVLANLSFGQRTIKGVIKDAQTKEPLIGATVLIQSTQRGVATDRFGKFSLEIQPQDDSLKISYTGYFPKTIPLSGNDFYQINLAIANLSGGCGVLVRDSPIEITMPAPFMKISNANLQRDNDAIITPSLNRVPGVFMQSGALNTNRITMRGIGNRSPFSTNKIRAYLNEIPLTSGDGETTIEDIDLSLINEVKVWKGPTASIYGAGLGGMIHLKTAPTDFKENIQTKLTVGSFGLVRNATDLKFTGNRFEGNVNFNYTASDGYRDNNQYGRQGITFLGIYRPSGKYETTILANLTDAKAFIPSSLGITDFTENPRNAAFTWGNAMGNEDYQKSIFGLSQKAQFLSKDNLWVDNVTSLFAVVRNNYELRPFNILDEASTSFGVRSVFNLNMPPINRTFPKASVGVEIFNENYDWKTLDVDTEMDLSDNKEQRLNYNLFAQSYFKIGERIDVLAGVNFNNTNYDYTDLFKANGEDKSGDYTFDWVVSPRLGLTYNFGYNYSLFATVSHGFSPPSVSETLTPSGVINPNIQPEKGWNFEIGSRGKWKKLTYEITAYQMNINDLIVIEPFDNFGNIIARNAGKTLHRGVEVYADWHVRKLSHEWRAFASYNFADYEFIDFLNVDVNFAGNAIPGQPPHHFNAGFDYKKTSGWYGNVNFQHVAAMPLNDRNFDYTTDYQLVNLKFGWQKRISTRVDLNFFGGIQNLLNEKYASMILPNARPFGQNEARFFYPGLPINYYGGVAAKYFF